MKRANCDSPGTRWSERPWQVTAVAVTVPSSRGDDVEDEAVVGEEPMWTPARPDDGGCDDGDESGNDSSFHNHNPPVSVVLYSTKQLLSFGTHFYFG